MSPLVSIYPVFPPFLHDDVKSCYCKALKEEILFTTHSETFSEHCVYGSTAVVVSAYATNLGGGIPGPYTIPIAELHVTSSTVRLISSDSKSMPNIRLS